jgi:hypothetical protein
MDPQDSSFTVYLSKEDEYKGDLYEGLDVEAPTIMFWCGRHLDIVTINRYSNVNTLKICTEVRRYNEETRSYEELEFGAEFPALTLKLKILSIVAQNPSPCVDLNGILGLKDTLRSLTLDVCLSNREAISELKNLEKLELHLNYKVENLEFLRGCTSIRKLRLVNYPDVKIEIVDLSPIASLVALKSLSLSLSGFCGLELLDQPLTSILIGACVGACRMDINKLPNLQYVERLELFSISTVDNTPIDLGFLSKAPRLKKLNLANIDITNFEILSTLTELKHLTTETCFGIVDIIPLSNLRLESLDLTQSSVVDISPLKDMVTLKTLNLTELPIVDCSVLATLTSLETLYFCDQEEFELQVIEELKLLKTLDLHSGRIRSGVRALSRIETVVHEDIEALTLTEEGESWILVKDYDTSIYTTGEKLVDELIATPNFYDPSSGLLTKCAQS